MIRTVTIFLLLQTTIVFGQKLTTSDSIALSKTWAKFVEDFSDKKTNNIKQYCYPKIDCLFCLTHEERAALKSFDYSVLADTFISKFYELIPNSKIWSVMKSEKPDFGIHHTGMYEVSIHTYKENELGKGHEGMQHIFQFEKAIDSFILWGFTSVP